MKRIGFAIGFCLLASCAFAQSLYLSRPSSGTGSQVFQSLKQGVFTLATTSFVAGQTFYMPFGGSQSGAATNEGTVQQPMPFGGTIKNLTVNLSAAPGTGNSVQIIFRVNGASPASGPTVTISDSATSGSDTTDSAAVTAGQLVDYEVIPSASATVSRVMAGAELDNP